MPTLKLTKRAIDSATPGTTRYDLCDTEVPGLRLRVHPSGVKTFQLFYRTRDGTQRRPTVGIYGAITLEQARKIALEWNGEVRAGKDPSQKRKDDRKGNTVSDLCDRYLKDHARPRKKPSSVAQDERYIRLFVRPHLGTRKVSSITRQDIIALHQSLSSTPYQANRVLALVSTMFNLAEKWGLRPDRTNPCYHVEKFPEHVKHRPLSDAELAALATVLDAAIESPPDVLDTDGKEIRQDAHAIEAIRLLMFTGCRRGEVLNLKWSEYDKAGEVLRLTDTKTGARIINLSPEAMEIIDRQTVKDGNPYVFPGRLEGQPLSDLKRVWSLIRKRAGLPDLRIHDLRHNLAATAAAQGQSLHQIGQLLGQKNPATTARYADMVLEARRRDAKVVGAALAAAIKNGKS